MSYEELRDAVAKAIGSPSFHNQPPGEHWWANLFDDHRYPYRVKADAVLDVIAKRIEGFPSGVQWSEGRDDVVDIEAWDDLISRAEVVEFLKGTTP